MLIRLKASLANEIFNWGNFLVITRGMKNCLADAAGYQRLWGVVWEFETYGTSLLLWKRRFDFSSSERLLCDHLLKRKRFGVFWGWKDGRVSVKRLHLNFCLLIIYIVFIYIFLLRLIICVDFLYLKLLFINIVQKEK